MSSQLARMISRGVRGALRNHPLIEKRALSTYNHGLPTDGLKKSSWKVNVSPCITNPRHPFLPCSIFSYTTSTDAQVEIDRCEKICKEMAKIHRVLLDYDEPHYHLIDGLEVLSAVSKLWKQKFNTNFEFDNDFGDLETSRILDQKATTTSKNNIISAANKWTILEFLLGCDDPELADIVLSSTMELWKILIKYTEQQCVKAERANSKDKWEERCAHIIAGLESYKWLISYVDDPAADTVVPNEIVKESMKLVLGLQALMKDYMKQVQAILNKRLHE